MFDGPAGKHAGKGIEMMWQAANRVDLGACAAAAGNGGERRLTRGPGMWLTAGVGRRNG